MFLEARKRGSDSWYLSGKMARGRVRWVCREHDRSSVGGMPELIRSSNVGCRPVGSRNEEENVDGKGWCRAGKVNRVGFGLVSSPTTVRKPPKVSSSGFFGNSIDRIPTSRRSFDTVPSILKF